MPARGPDVGSTASVLAQRQTHEGVLALGAGHVIKVVLIDGGSS